MGWFFSYYSLELVLSFLWFIISFSSPKICISLFHNTCVMWYIGKQDLGFLKAFSRKYSAVLQIKFGQDEPEYFPRLDSVLVLKKNHWLKRNFEKNGLGELYLKGRLLFVFENKSIFFFLKVFENIVKFISQTLIKKFAKKKLYIKVLRYLC